MNKTLKLISLAFMFVFSTVFTEPKAEQDPHRLYVTKVDPEFHCFVLSNNMMFYSIKNEWKTENLPDVGTEVKLLPAERHPEKKNAIMEEGEFKAIYAIGDRKRSLFIWMPPESEQYCFSYVASKQLSVKPAGWFSARVNQEIIELSDGSKWLVEPKETELGFSPGDHVIVAGVDEARHMLINVNRMFYSHINQTDKTLGWYRYAVVKPYVEATKE
jgi:hypothetical protein